MASLFTDLMTQWRTGMNGPIGLDYGAVIPIFRIRRIAREKWGAMLDDIKVMENEALITMQGEAQ